MVDILNLPFVDALDYLDLIGLETISFIRSAISCVSFPLAEKDDKRHFISLLEQMENYFRSPKKDIKEVVNPEIKKRIEALERKLKRKK